jgi:hypothetical protein
MITRLFPVRRVAELPSSAESYICFVAHARLYPSSHTPQLKNMSIFVFVGNASGSNLD